jgi:hypothetical protein
MCIPWKSEENMKKNVHKSIDLHRKSHAFPGHALYESPMFFSSKDAVNGYQKTQISKI